MLIRSLGLLTVALPMTSVLRSFVQASNVEVVYSYIFPSSFTHEDFTAQSESWVRNAKLRAIVSKYRANGLMKSAWETSLSNGKNYHFSFASKADSLRFHEEILASGTVDKAARERLGLQLNFKVVA